MKRLLVYTMFLIGISQAQDELVGSRKIEMLPDEKRALTLKPSENNPYAKRAVVQEETPELEQNSEEVALRSKLSSLQVTGSSRSPRGMILLFGDILIERGRVLPQLIANQTQLLKVTDVTNEKIVLGWLDTETGELTGKTMQINYDLAPNVRHILQGQGQRGGELEMGIIRPDKVSGMASNP